MSDNPEHAIDLTDISEAVLEDIRLAMMDHSGGALMTAYRDWVNGTGNPVANFDELLSKDGGSPKANSLGISFAHIRDQYIFEFGFCAPTPEFIHKIVQSGPVLKIGAGLGTLSRLINNAGGDAIATDLVPRYISPPENQSWSNVIEMDASQAVTTYPERVVLCSWPSLGENWLTKAAKAMARDQLLIVVGEDLGGCTASDCFFKMIGRELEPCQEILGDADVWQFPRIHDHVTAFRRT